MNRVRSIPLHLLGGYKWNENTNREKSIKEWTLALLSLPTYFNERSLHLIGALNGWFV